MQIKTDCFAYKPDNIHNKCNILKKLYCKFEECKFYKNKETFKTVKK